VLSEEVPHTATAIVVADGRQPREESRRRRYSRTEKCSRPASFGDGERETDRMEEVERYDFDPMLGY
jgi:hypothetical protein